MPRWSEDVKRSKGVISQLIIKSLICGVQKQKSILEMPLLYVLGFKLLPRLLNIGSVILVFRVSLDNTHSLEMKDSLASSSRITS